MLAASSAREIEVVELTAEQEQRCAASECRRLLGIEIGEFTRRWRNGDYRNSDDPKFTQVAMLLPDAWESRPFHDR